MHQLRSAALGSVVEAVVGSVARRTSGLEFVGDRAARLLERRVVVEFEEVGALAVDALVTVELHGDALLGGGGVSATL